AVLASRPFRASLSSAQDHEHDISNAPLATPVYTVSNFNSLLGVETKCAVKWRKKHRAARAHRSGARRGGFLERRGESVGVQRGDCMKNRTPERKEM
ncbi:hypothetical protein KDW10_15460, partial [Burkholderia vietnamiensis]|uniref:hypothetical protein n=1 Tax=Burkholderia vietnamiensis TaxID=60552 RepID=UPI001B8F1B4F